MTEIKIQDIQAAVERLYTVLESLGGTKGSPAVRYEAPEPAQEGADVWFDTKALVICVGTQGEAALFNLDQIELAENHILEYYGDEGIIF
jgi:hypothetical protein